MPAVMGFKVGIARLKAIQALPPCQGKVRKRLRNWSNQSRIPCRGGSNTQGPLFGSCITPARRACIRSQYVKKRTSKAQNPWAEDLPSDASWRRAISPGLPTLEKEDTDGDR